MIIIYLFLVFFSTGNPGSLGARGPMGDVGYPGSYVLKVVFYLSKFHCL